MWNKIVAITGTAFFSTLISLLVPFFFPLWYHFSTISFSSALSALGLSCFDICLLHLFLIWRINHENLHSFYQYICHSFSFPELRHPKLISISKNMKMMNLNSSNSILPTSVVFQTDASIALTYSIPVHCSNWLWYHYASSL